MRRTFSLAGALVAAAAAMLVLAGCQDMFTWSPVKLLARGPDALSAEQQVSYGKDALASGDAAAMTAAYEQLKDQDTADGQYVAAQLGIELSGVPDLFMGLIDGTVALDPAFDIGTFITDNNLSPDFLIEAAAELEAAQGLGADLGAMDYVMGAMGLALGAAGPTYDLAALTPESLQPALDFLAPAVDEVSTLPADDPLRMLIEGYSDYLGSV